MTLLILVAIVSGLVAIASLVWGVAAPKARAHGRVRDIEAYGYSAAVASHDEVRVKKGTIPQRIGELIGDRFGTEGDSKMRRELLAAGMYKVNPRQIVGYQLLIAVIGGAIGLATDPADQIKGPILDTALLALAGWVLPTSYIRRTGRLRLGRLDRTLPDAIDLIVVSVEAGQGFAQAMQTAAERTTGSLGDELKLTLQEQRFGLSMEQALVNFNTRCDTPNVRTFVRGVVQGEKLGVSIGQIMRNIARDMRLRRRQAAEERAQKTTVKILFPLVFLILPAMILVLIAPAITRFGDIFSG